MVDLAEVKNRLHTVANSSTTPRVILVDLKQAQAAFERRLVKMRSEASKLIQAEPVLRLAISVAGQRTGHCADQRTAYPERTAVAAAWNDGAAVGGL